MQFVEPYVQAIYEQDNFKRIEICGKTCYKSEANITETSAYPFFQKMCKSGHTSVLEHSAIFVRSHTPEAYLELLSILNAYTEDQGLPHYIRYSVFDGNETFYKTERGICTSKEHLFSGNIRAWRNIIERFNGEYILRDLFSDHPAFSDIFFNADKEQFGEERALDIQRIDSIEYKEYDKSMIEVVNSIPTDTSEFKYADMHNIATLKIVGDRGLIDEFARHRSFGISVESSRYCNYSGNGVTYCFPFWFDKVKKEPLYASLGGLFGNICYDAEKGYQEIMEKIKIPQIARGSLNLWTKSEIALTGTIDMWKRLINLRDSPAAHPEAQKVSKLIEIALVEELGVKDYWGVVKA